MLEEQLITLGILFFCAIIGAAISSRLRQPAVIGLLLIGALIGPHALNLVNDHELIELITEFGAVLLLFVIGLEFVIPKLLKIGFKAFIFGLLKTGTLLFMIYQISLLLGFSRTAALVFGVMFSLSSTVVIVKVLESKGLYHRQEVPLLIGILIIEDLMGVVALTFLDGAQGGSGIFAIIERLIVSIGLLVIAYLVLLKFSKRIVSWFMKSGDEEIVTFLALGICAVFSYFAYFLGLSAATGAFLAGSIVASLPDVKLFEHAIKPYTLVFSSLFFLAVGTLTDLSVLRENMSLLIILLASIIAVCFIAVGSVSYLFASFQRQQVIFSSIAMIPIGEFSLLIAQSAMSLELGIDFVSIATFIIFSSAIVMSILINYFEPVSEYIVSSAPKNLNDRPKSFSNFMKILSLHLDQENANSKRFKEESVSAFTSLLFLVFSFILSKRIYPYVSEDPLMRWGFIFALIGASAFLSVKLYRSSRNSLGSLATVIGDAYFSGSRDRSKRIIRRTLTAFMLLVITLYSPVIEVLFKVPHVIINTVSLVLLVVTLFRFQKLFEYTYKTAANDNFRPKVRKARVLKLDHYDR